MDQQLPYAELTGSPRMPRLSLQLTQNHERIIRLINRYHYLTAEQFLTLLGYSDGNIKTLKAYLKELTDAKYLHSFYLPATSKSRPFVYGLGMRGRKYLQKTDEWNGVYSLPSESEEKTYYTLMHILELNDFLIAVEDLTRLHPSLHLFDMQHDLTHHSHIHSMSSPEKGDDTAEFSSPSSKELACHLASRHYSE